jgi:hypothetical protein
LIEESEVFFGYYQDGHVFRGCSHSAELMTGQYFTMMEIDNKYLPIPPGRINYVVVSYPLPHHDNGMPTLKAYYAEPLLNFKRSR